MTTKSISGLLMGGIVIATSLFPADEATAAVFRYRLSGDWSTITDGTSEGWGLNPNNSGAPGALPGSADDARINWGGNTVTVTTSVPAVNRVQIGVDESGIVDVNAGGVLTANADVLAGNNNVNATGTLNVNNGGIVNVGNILWAANNSSTGFINILGGGQVNVASHLWLGVTGAAQINISGTLNQTGGILGLGTNDAVNPTGGTATMNVLDGGLLALNNISGGAGLPSIQAGSVLDLQGSGQLTLPGDLTGLVQQYVDAGKITGNGLAGNVSIDLTTNPGFTTAIAIPEPSTTALLGLLGLGAFLRRRR